MSSRYLYLVRMDVAHDLEPTFNEVYDTEHAPLLAAVPGVLRASRYRSPSPTYPRYIAAYELESPAVLQSAEWKAAGEAGRWAGEIRPHTMNRHLAMYEWVGSNAGLTYRTPYVFWVFMDVEKHREDLFNELYDTRARPAAAQAARLRQRGALPHGSRGRAALPRRLRGRPHRPAHVQALERHLGHRPLEARGAPLHVQQALHRRRAHLAAELTREAHGRHPLRRDLRHALVASARRLSGTRRPRARPGMTGPAPPSRHRPATPGLEAHTEVALELASSASAERSEVGRRDARLGLDLDRRVIAQDEVDLEARCRAPMGQPFPGNVVRVAASARA